jgi:hypothetical protein
MLETVMQTESHNTQSNIECIFCLKIIAKLKYTELGHLCFEVEVDIEKLRKYTCPGIDQIAAVFESSRWCVNAL